MIVRCTSGDRGLIISLLERKTGVEAVYRPMPEFSCVVGAYTLKRDGAIEWDDDRSDDKSDVLETLSELGLCEAPGGTLDGGESVHYSYPLDGHTGKTLLNLMCMISARYRLINNALGCRGAFYITPELVNDLLAHPPVTIDEFRRSIYGRDEEYKGLKLTDNSIILDGFRRGKPEEAHVHRQLADMMIREALARQWIKPFTRNVRNRKYAMKTWLVTIGMNGVEYAEARTVMLGRLYGRSDKRVIPKKTAGTGGEIHDR